MTTYSRLDQLLASPTHPLAADDVTNRVNLAEHSLLMLVSGKAEWDHWALLRVMANFMEVFVDLGYALDPGGLVSDADIVLRFAALDAKLTDCKPRVGHGPAGVLLALIEDYAECLREVPARSAIRAMRTTERAMAKLPPL